MTPATLTVVMFGIVGMLVMGYFAKNLWAQKEKPPVSTMRDLPMAVSPIKAGTVITENHLGVGRADRTKLTPDVLLASACLPFLFQAVTIEGEPYWDGGYMGNPAIFPLIYGAETPDVVIVQVNPLGCDKVPTSAPEIMNRLNEISFNSSLMREMRAISFVTDLIDEGKLASNQYKRINVHWIEAEKQMRGLGVSSKLNARMDFLLHLKEIGRQVAGEWIATHFDAVGQRSTIDIKEMFL